MQKAFAIDINPGESRTECPGTKITLGGHPTAGPDPESNYTFAWHSIPAGFSSSEANPEITVPDVKTVYVVRVTDVDGFTCQESVTITPVLITGIQFNPSYLQPDGKSTSQATAITDTKGRSFVWSISGPAGTDASVGETNGVVRASTKPATVKVKVQDRQAIENKTETCYKEENICIGDPEECCPDLSGEMMFGLIRVRLTESIKSLGSADDGYCSYATNKVRVHFDLEGFLPTPVSYDLEGVMVTWQQKGTGASRSFKDVKLTWTGKAPTRNFGPLMANLIGLSIQVNSDGVISGDTRFTINQTQEISLGGMAVLDKGTTGDFTFKYNNSNGFQGDYDFGGVKNIDIKLKKNKSVLAEASGGLDSKGNLINGVLMAKNAATFSTDGFTVTLKKLVWKFEWKIRDNDVIFKDGTAELSINNIRNTKGEVDLYLTLDGKTAEGKAKFEKLQAFGCTIQGTLQASVNADFDIHEISGSNIKAKHPEFESSFEIVEFSIVKGELTAFDFKGNVKYKKIIFNVSKAAYVKDKGLSLSAKIELGKSSKCDVTDFNISSEGVISKVKMAFGTSIYPFTLNGSLAYESGTFKGTYSGTMEGGIKIGGKIELGAMDTYNYAFFELEMQSAKGFKVGPVIKIDELAGRFGYNYDYLTSSASPGTYAIGIGLGIKDVADIIGLKGDVTIIIGNKNALELIGEVRVPAKSPHYFKGTLTANYFLGTNEVSGSTSAALKIPARDGSIISLSTKSITFGLNQGGWYVKGMNMSGQIMKEVNMTATIDLRGASGDGEGITGMVSGTIDYSKEMRLIYPKTFNPTNCATADNSDTRFGFGIDGYFKIELGGGFNSQVNSEGFTGSIRTHASGASNVQVKWPCLVTCGDCVKRGSVNVSGDMELKYQNGVRTLMGTMNLEGKENERETKKIEITF